MKTIHISPKSLLRSGNNISHSVWVAIIIDIEFVINTPFGGAK